jgi:HSP20 family protein
MTFLAGSGLLLGQDRLFGGAGRWPNIENLRDRQGSEGHRRVAGLEEKDIEVELANGVLIIKGEKRTETEDKDRLFSERYYGRFERRIPVDEVEEDKVSALFKNGVLTITLPKSAKAQEKVKRIGTVMAGSGLSSAGSKRSRAGWGPCGKQLRLISPLG